MLLMLHHSLFLSLFPPQFHRAVPLLQTCSTTEFACDHVCFCVYVCLWIYLPNMRENMHLLCFWSWLSPLNTKSSNYIHLPSNAMSFWKLITVKLCWFLWTTMMYHRTKLISFMSLHCGFYFCFRW
jgi:hypothetical protein